MIPIYSTTHYGDIVAVLKCVLKRMISHAQNVKHGWNMISIWLIDYYLLKIWKIDLFDF